MVSDIQGRSNFHRAISSTIVETAKLLDFHHDRFHVCCRRLLPLGRLSFIFESFLPAHLFAYVFIIAL